MGPWALLRRLAAVAVIVFLGCQAAWAAPAGQTPLNTRFVAIAFGDVVDPGQSATVDSVSVENLVAFLDWLKADGWTPITTADVSAAAHGRRSLPVKAILLGFDGGFASFHDRVYPLLLAYRYPAMVSLVGQWMDQPPGSMIDYDGTPVPRERFLTWDQVRRMQASGLVEVASHGYDLRKTVLINRQGNSSAAARSWLYDEAGGRIETDEQHRARIRADLVRSRDLIARETGTAPHALSWPFGRFSGPAVEVARELGFDQLYTLTEEAADARDPLNIPRYAPTFDPDLGAIVASLQFNPPVSPTLRAACVDLSALAEARDSLEQDAVLGRMVEDLRHLGPNIVIIDPLRFSPDGARPMASWVPTELLPLEADIFSRAARQLGLRGGADVYVRLRLPALVEALGEQGAIELARQVARQAPITGLALDASGAVDPARVLDPAKIRSVRASATATSPLAVRVMHAAMEIDPQLRLMAVANASEPAGLPDGADMVLWPPASDARGASAQAARLKAAGWFGPGASGRIFLAVPQLDPEHQVRSIRAMQEQGANALALCPWEPADSAALAPAFSAATFPYRP